MKIEKITSGSIPSYIEIKVGWTIIFKEKVMKKLENLDFIIIRRYCIEEVKKKSDFFNSYNLYYFDEFTEKKGVLIFYNNNLYLISKLEEITLRNLNLKFCSSSIDRELKREIDDIVTNIKHYEYLKDKKFNQLKKQVELFEKISDVEKSLTEGKSNREPIAEDVKILVWRRDEGKCVNCNSQKNLEFDHIIPFSKGGSNTARNIQILCQDCNRKKADKI